jgi:hypothetical protein
MIAALILEQACGRERPVVDLPDDLLLAGVRAPDPARTPGNPEVIY